MDKYVRGKRLGRGSFGTVYQVWRRDATVGAAALGVLKEMVIHDVEQRCGARQEALVLSRLDHPNVIRYLDSFQEPPNLVCLVMEYCSGGDLQRKIQHQRGIHFDQATVVNWTRQLASALRYIHSLKILHRDVKSGNVFLLDSRPDAQLKLGDFGVAKVLHSTRQMARTCVGTPIYLSPEICDRRQYDAKSDVWGLGCIVYQLMCLRAPFAGRDLKDLMARIVSGRYAPIPQRYSYELRLVVAQMLRKDPNQRPSAEALLRKSCLAVAGAGATPTAGAASRRPSRPTACKNTTVKALGALSVYLPAVRKGLRRPKTCHSPRRRHWNKPSDTLVGALADLKVMDQTWTIDPSPFHQLEATKCRFETRLGLSALKTVWSAMEQLWTTGERQVNGLAASAASEQVDPSTAQELAELFVAEQHVYAH